MWNAIHLYAWNRRSKLELIIIRKSVNLKLNINIKNNNLILNKAISNKN